ncbi:BadF/BadG/BcrA/BcrD ATPase family protein [Candidatus Kapaibacterium sp.]
MINKNDYTIIGIDGGGTKTRGIIYSEGSIKAELVAGTTRIGAVGVGESCERTLTVITELCQKANIEISEVDAIVVGLAGVWLEEEKMRSQNLIRTLARSQKTIINDLLVTSDAEIALEGAFGGRDGIMTIVGTGSIALGKFHDKLYRCGGWGIELDDEGSGAWIGREGLTAVVRALDGRGEPTILADEIAQLYPTINLDEPRTIVKAYAERAFEYQNLTPYVMKCAENGDKICMRIITDSAKHLSELPDAIIKNVDKFPVNVALMGGIIDANTILRKLLEEEISKKSKLKIVKPAGSALDGAISIGFGMIKQDMEN